MNGMNKRTAEISAGHRVIAVKGLKVDLNGYYQYDGIRIETVKDIDQNSIQQGHHAIGTLQHGEDVRKVVFLAMGGISETEFPSPWKVMWTEDLPARDDDAIDYFKAVQMKHQQRTALMWVSSIRHDGIAFAHLISDRQYTEDQLTFEDGKMGYGPRPLLIRYDGLIHERALYGIVTKKASFEDGQYIHEVENVHNIMSNVSLLEALDRLPGRELKNLCGNLMAAGMLEENEDRAYASSKPSEALVAAWKEGNSVCTAVIGSSGIAFWNNDDANCYAESEVPGPGLWLWHDVKWFGYTSHEGEHDATMEGDWSPATDQDIERLWGDRSNLIEEIAAYSDLSLDNIDIDEWIAAAKEEQTESA